MSDGGVCCMVPQSDSAGGKVDREVDGKHRKFDLKLDASFNVVERNTDRSAGRGRSF